MCLYSHGCGFESQLARALKERQCTLKGQAWYVNVWGSVHRKGVCGVGDRDLGGAKFFNWFLKLTNQRRPKSHMFSTSLRLTNHKQLTAK